MKIGMAVSNDLYRTDQMYRNVAEALKARGETVCVVNAKRDAPEFRECDAVIDASNIGAYAAEVGLMAPQADAEPAPPIEPPVAPPTEPTETSAFVAGAMGAAEPEPERFPGHTSKHAQAFAEGHGITDIDLVPFTGDIRDIGDVKRHLAAQPIDATQP